MQQSTLRTAKTAPVTSNNCKLAVIRSHSLHCKVDKLFSVSVTVIFSISGYVHAMKKTGLAFEILRLSHIPITTGVIYFKDWGA